MTCSRKLIIPALAALGLVALMSVEAGAGKHEFSYNVDDLDMSQNHELDSGSSGGKNGDGADSGGNDGGKLYGGYDATFWQNQNRRQIACYNGYGVILVRDIRDCGPRAQRQRRVRIGGGYNYGGGLVATKNGGGYATGGGYVAGGGYAVGGGYAYQQPIVRYYKPASRAAVMQAERRARRAAQYNYGGGGYGYDNGGFGGGYVMNYGAVYGGGYAVQMGYGNGHKAKHKNRRHRGQVQGMMGGNGVGYNYGVGYGYDAGYGAGFGYGGTVVHYGPVLSKSGGY